MLDTKFPTNHIQFCLHTIFRLLRGSLGHSRRNLDCSLFSHFYIRSHFHPIELQALILFGFEEWGLEKDAYPGLPSLYCRRRPYAFLTRALDLISLIFCSQVLSYSLNRSPHYLLLSCRNYWEAEKEVRLVLLRSYSRHSFVLLFHSLTYLKAPFINYRILKHLTLFFNFLFRHSGFFEASGNLERGRCEWGTWDLEARYQTSFTELVPPKARVQFAHLLALLSSSF